MDFQANLAPAAAPVVINNVAGGSMHSSNSIFYDSLFLSPSPNPRGRRPGRPRGKRNKDKTRGGVSRA